MRQLVGKSNLALMHLSAEFDRYLSSSEPYENRLPIEMRNLFFQPYQSGWDLTGRTAAIATAPLFGLSVIIVLALNVAENLMASIASLIVLDFERVLAHLGYAAKLLLQSFVAVPLLVLTPLIELTDIIGSAINSCILCCEKHDTSNNGSFVL